MTVRVLNSYEIEWNRKGDFMGAHSSGYYSIDGDYNIIGFNETAKEIYPSLQMGMKCYKALMGLDAPCPPCPVVNGICGPKTYLDPIRHIYETVDAVDTILPDGSRGHALVFSTVAEGERLSSAIPTGEKSLRLLGAVNRLASDYVAVYSVNRQQKTISVYRSEFTNDPDNSIVKDNADYDTVREYLTRYIHPDDRSYVLKKMELDYLEQKLADSSSFRVHFRSAGEETHYYYLLVTRNGETEDEQDFVIAAACEDNDVNARKIYENQLNSLIGSISHAAGYFHLDITDDKILKTGGTSAIVDTLKSDCTIDAFVRDTAQYIPKEQDRQDFIDAFCRNSMLKNYNAGQVEITRISRCYYDDNIARISKYVVRLLINPSNNHLEGLLYGVDITRSQEEYETQVSIVRTLSSNYRDVYLLNLREKTLSIIKEEEGNEDGLKKKEDGSYSYKKFLAKYIEERVHPDDRDMLHEVLRLRNVRKRIRKKEEYKGNYRVKNGDEIHYYQFRVIRNEDSGIIVLGFLNVDDVVEAEIRQQKLLKEALDTAERASEAKTNFLRRMSHDIRTPINGICGMLEVADYYHNDINKLAECREKIRDASHLLLELINEVLDMGKLESGEIMLEEVPFNLHDIEQNVLEVIEKMAEERKIEITQDNIGVAHWNLIGSPVYVKRIMMNFISNAVKYNKEHGKIMLRCREISTEGDTAVFEFTCRDTGIGMSREFQEHLFEPFTQERVGGYSKYGSTGLGMSITMGLVKRMGGDITFESEKDKGTTFVITIPFKIDTEKREAEQKAKKSVCSIAGMNILLVEDNELNMEIVEFITQNAGAVVTKAWNGREALEIFEKSAEGCFDAILMDVMMPEMDGYEATERIRRLNRKDARTIPIIAMTANAFTEDKIRSKEAGMNEHIAKPLNTELVLRAVAKLVQPQMVD